MEENNFKLLDLIGTEDIFDYNPSKNILVYSIGCMIVYWELTIDKKLFIKYHEGTIGYLKFSKSGNYLISIDKLFSPHLVIWELPSLQIYFRNYIPLNNNYIKDDLKYLRDRPAEEKINLIFDIYLEFLTTNKFIILINTDNKQILFNFEFSKEINLIFDSTIEVEASCIGLKVIEEDTFITLEDKTIKFWKINFENKIKLLTKIHFKQKLIKDALDFCEYLKLITLLNANGSCLILDHNGNFLISLTCVVKQEIFNSSFIMNELLLLGGDKGNVYVYALNGFKLISVFKYDCNYKIKNLFQINNENNTINNQIYGPSITNIFANEDNDVIILKYSDNSILINNLSSFQFVSKNVNKNLSKNNSSYLNYSSHLNVKLNIFGFSHFGNIKDIIWLNDEPKTFFTCSDDQSFMMWIYKGDKWVNNYFDLLKTFDSNLNNFTQKMIKQMDNNLKTNNNNNDGMLNSNFLQILILHPRYQNTLIGGDNKGNLYIFDLEALKVGKINNINDNNITNFNYKNTKNNFKKIVVGNFPITTLNFSKNGNYLAIGFSTGLVILSEFYNDCKFCIKLEDHFIDQNNTNFTFNFVEIMKIKGIKNDLNNNFKNVNNYKENKNTKSNFYYTFNNDENSLRIITLKDSNTFRIQNVTLQKTTFLKSTFKELNFNYKIKNAILHPSEDYLIVLLEPNLILIKKIETNQTCGEILPYMNIYDIKLDPSGLYLAILGEYLLQNNDNNLNKDELVLPSNSITGNNYFNKNLITIKSEKLNNKYAIENNFNNNFNIDNNLNKTNSNLTKQRNYFNNSTNQPEFKSIKTNLAFYELGTGHFFSTLNNNFKISNFKFSNDGRFLNISSDSGCVSVWQLPKEMKENIISVLDEMRRNNKFWDSFRINYKNLENNENNEIGNNNYNEIISKSLNISQGRENISNMGNAFREIDINKNNNVSYRESIKTNSKSGFIIKNEFKKKDMEDSMSNLNNLPKLDNLNNKTNKEIQTSDFYLEKSNSIHNYDCYDIDDKSAKSIYVNLSYPTTHTNDNRNKNNFNKNSSKITTNKSNKEIFDLQNLRKNEEWNNSHNYGGMGLSDENMRILNKDTSIYSTKQSNIIKYNKNNNNNLVNDYINKGYSPNYSNSPKNIVTNLNKARIEDFSKMRNDEIRNINIENAMRELKIKNGKKSNFVENKNYKIKRNTINNNNDNSLINNSSSNQLYKNSNLNYYINRSKENSNQILAEPIDIDDDIIEGNNFKNNSNNNNHNLNYKSNNQKYFQNNLNSGFTSEINSNTSNFYRKTKESITDEIEFANDNIDNFEKMHNLI